MPVSIGDFKKLIHPGLERIFMMKAFWVMLPPGHLEDWQYMQAAVEHGLEPGEIWDEAVKRGYIRPDGVDPDPDEAHRYNRWHPELA